MIFVVTFQLYHKSPFFCNGTVRSNLNPLGEYKDHQLWNSLKAVQLEKVIKDLECRLGSKIVDYGSNFKRE